MGEKKIIIQRNTGRYHGQDIGKGVVNVQGF